LPASWLTPSESKAEPSLTYAGAGAPASLPTEASFPWSSSFSLPCRAPPGAGYAQAGCLGTITTVHANSGRDHLAGCVASARESEMELSRSCSGAGAPASLSTEASFPWSSSFSLPCRAPPEAGYAQAGRPGKWHAVYQTSGEHSRIRLCKHRSCGCAAGPRATPRIPQGEPVPRRGDFSLAARRRETASLRAATGAEPSSMPVSTGLFGKRAGAALRRPGVNGFSRRGRGD